MNPCFSRTCRAIFFGVAALGVLASCSSPSDRRAGRPAARPRIQPLAASAEFFSGRVLAEVRLAPLRAEAFHAAGPRAGAEGEQRMRNRAGDDGPDGGLGGPRRGGGPDGGMRPGRQGFGPRSAAPNASIHVQLTNRSDAPLAVAIRDFVLPLGNFAVRPEVIELAPGETKEVEPMAASAAGELNEMPVTLRLHTSDGSEEQHLTLVPAPSPARDPEARRIPE